MGQQTYKINVSEEHRHMIRLYMVRHRLSSMQTAAARMIESVMQAEGPYTYSPPKEMSHNGNENQKAAG